MDFWPHFFGICGIYMKFSMFSKKKMNLRGQVFLKLMTPNDVLIYMHKRASF